MRQGLKEEEDEQEEKRQRNLAPNADDETT
jgi:hypothetical protein